MGCELAIRNWRLIRTNPFPVAAREWRGDLIGAYRIVLPDRRDDKSEIPTDAQGVTVKSMRATTTVPAARAVNSIV